MRTIRRQRGISLIELMVALVLGLVVIGGATAVFLSNKEAYRSNAALGQLQENARIAFELIARDLRQAGLTGCGNLGRVANVLQSGPSGTGTKVWYADFANAIRGYDGASSDPAVTTGSGTAQRIAGTDSLMLIGAAEAGYSIASHVLASNTITLNETGAALGSGDLIFICDPDHAVIAQISAWAAPTATIAGSGNCSTGLGFPTSCSAGGNPYQFAINSQLAPLAASDWYIGNNPQGTRSLYRRAVVTTGGAPTPTAQEMLRNVDDLQLAYHAGGGSDFVNATAVADWSGVDADRITLSLSGTDTRAGTGGAPIRRVMTATLTLRNRTH